MTASAPVTFSYSTWVAMFSEFAPLEPEQGNAYFMRATGGIIGNSVTNPVFCDGNLEYLIYLATSHVAWLSCPKDANGNPSATGGASSAIVGRISSATEGSVSVTSEFPMDSSASAQEKYLAQTKYGVELWSALAPYRTARYAARPTIVVGGRFSPYIGGRYR